MWRDAQGIARAANVVEPFDVTKHRDVLLRVDFLHQSFLLRCTHHQRGRAKVRQNVGVKATELSIVCCANIVQSGHGVREVVLTSVALRQNHLVLYVRHQQVVVVRREDAVVIAVRSIVPVGIQGRITTGEEVVVKTCDPEQLM